MNAQPRRIVLRIHGMCCAEEVGLLRRAVGPIVGGDERLGFDVLNGKMTVDTPVRLDVDAVVAAVHQTGMRAELFSAHGPSDPEIQARRHRRVRSQLTLVSGASVFLGFLLHAWIAGDFAAAIGVEGLGEGHAVPLAASAAYVVAIVTGGWFVAPRAWFAVQQLRPDMNLLMTIAVLGAVGIGEWFEGATVAFLFALSLALEAWSLGRARRAIEALMSLAPPTARVVEGDRERELPVEDVAVGSRILVKPGEEIPLDGVVREGASSVNQAPITGESLPVGKEAGAQVFAGTINGDGALEIVTTKPANDTTLARIIRTVADAHARRAHAEQWVDQFARVYTPAIMALAIAIVLIPPVLFNQPWFEWLYRGLVLLVIGCPCALVISTPVTIVAALAAAARHGVLVKGGLYLEIPARLTALALDKTGTLTEGKPRVVDVATLDGTSERELLEIAAGLESRSEHPLARAILAHAAAHGVTPAPVQAFEILKGKGATGRINGESYWLGSHRYLEERGQESLGLHARLDEMTAAGRTIVVLGTSTRVLGLISIADGVRPISAQVVRELRDLGVGHIVMLTGDNVGTANAIAQHTGVDEVHAELLPHDKVAVIERLVARYGAVGMIGDGVNDAPAMARATLGIAMGAAGSDAAIEAADVALMDDDLAKVPWLVRHSRRALRVMRQNITVSLVVKAVFVVLTFTGFASLWAAIAADMGMSLLVIMNALRLLHTRS